MATGYIDPNGDGATLEWASTAATHYTEIAKGVRQPTAPTLLAYISDSGIPENETRDDIILMGTLTGVSSVSAVQVWAYGVAQQPAVIKADIYMAGGWQGLVSLNPTTSWDSASWVGAWTQADLDALQVKFRWFWPDAGQNVTVYALYGKVTYVSIEEAAAAQARRPWGPGWGDQLPSGWADR